MENLSESVSVRVHTPLGIRYYNVTKRQIGRTSFPSHFSPLFSTVNSNYSDLEIEFSTNRIRMELEIIDLLKTSIDFFHDLTFAIQFHHFENVLSTPECLLIYTSFDVLQRRSQHFPFLTSSKEKKHNLSNYIRLINRPKKPDGNLENWERKKFYSLPRNGRSSQCKHLCCIEISGRKFRLDVRFEIGEGKRRRRGRR